MILDRLDSSSTTLDSVLDDCGPLIAGMPRRDRSLFNQLVYGVLRWRLYLDAVIDTYASRPLKKIAPRVLNILRLGLLQIRFLDRIPASAAVNTAVDLARTGNTAKASGFVNAVLRNALRAPQRFRLPDADQAPVDHLSVATSVPRWLASRWIDRMGFDQARRLCDAINTIPPISLRCNQLKNALPELMAALAQDAQEITAMEAVPGGINLNRPRQAIADMPAFAEGRFAVQDGAAQLVSLMLAPRPGETVLDACAGLGGKTTHLAQIMENRGRIIAMDRVAAKLTRLQHEARRLGITVTDTQTADLDRPLDRRQLPDFDRILLDAPCTGLGVLRRNPDAKWSTVKPDIGRCARRQVRLLDHLAPLLKPGGVMVFSVCSIEPEENEQVVAHFLKKHPNFAITKRQSIEENSVRAHVAADGFLRTAPHIHQLDGFFAARLHRLH
jgi:16S rRNA (cytosine967-C5)-methyltransferase